MTICTHEHTSFAPCCGFAECFRLAWWQKENLPKKTRKRVTLTTTHHLRGRPLLLSFGTVGCERSCIPATLSTALTRPCLVYPLASLDVSGQWPVVHADASPNKESIYVNTYTLAKSQSQGSAFKILANSHLFYCQGRFYPVPGSHCSPSPPIFPSRRSALPGPQPQTPYWI